MSRPVLGLSLAMAATVGLLVGVVAGLTGGGNGPGGGDPAARALFADIVERANPAVVYISVIEDTNRHAVGFTRSPDPGPRRGDGSGFIIDPAGYIVTNQHVVGGNSRIRVRLADRRELPARVLGSDPRTDLALLKVEATGLPVLPLGDSDRLRVGEWVCAIGNPYQYEHSVTVGVVSSKGRKIYDASFDAYIQTDAAINPGNSGGPLLNARGEAVGINAAVSMQGQGIGFAVPINVARGVLEQLRSRGRVSRGYLGIQLDDVDPDLARLLQLQGARGAVVVDVQKGSAGEAAGLRRYDVITAAAGTPVADGDQLVRVVAAHRPGSTVELSLVRDRQPLSLSARLGERQPDDEDASEEAGEAAAPASGGDALGLVVEELTREARASLKVPPDRRGVVVEVVAGLSTGLDSLEEGDVVVEVDRRPTPDLAAYRQALSALHPGDWAWLYVYRPGGAAFLAKVEVEPER